MFEIVFLGTSASAPSVHRGLSSLFVQHDEYRFLVDCGEGTQRQILRAGVGFKRLNQILLTHGHLDHILGLGGLVSTFLRWEVMEEIEIYGTRHTLDRVYDLIFGVVLRGFRGKPPVILHEIEPGVFFEAERFNAAKKETDRKKQIDDARSPKGDSGEIPAEPKNYKNYDDVVKDVLEDSKAKGQSFFVPDY